TTLNEEMANRNVELTSAYNDLSNLLASAKIPIVMLEADLRIRRITPPAEKLLNLIPADVGRPLRDINMRIEIPDLDMKILKVIDTVTPLEEEVRDRDGNLYLLGIRPFLTPERKIDGAILSILEISRLKMSYEKLARALEYANAILQTTREPVMVLEETLRVHTVNRAFCETFRVGQEYVEHRILGDVGNGEWRNPRLRKLLHRVLTHDHPVRDFRLEADYPGIGHRILMLNAHRLSPVEGTSPMIFLSIEDATIRLSEKGRGEKGGTAPAAGRAPAGKERPSR
ncbi:MAG: PAS domain-containing protein, partial [Deltaproteobacteria bacterium]|nr:PAS domain-containing protein [Candidatus Deferrimicrobiaceae bacterium]